MAQPIYRFSAKLCDYKSDPATKTAKALLGGKGGGLVMMAKHGLNVPPGFTITTAVCNVYRSLTDGARDAFIDDLMQQVAQNMVWLQDQFGYMPLVSVRSGAPVSMPGMMDTILNVGLCNENYKAWCQRIGQRSTHDSDRRLTQMLGSTGYGVPMAVFDFQLAKVKKELGAKSDSDLDVIGLSKVISEYRKAFEANKGFKFPFDNPQEQLRVAIRAVFDSWMNPRAIEYRKINGLSDAMGTAVNVQAMVFGNMGETSGTGVLFTRDPSTGKPGVMGEFLQNAQGEDVVAGIRTPLGFDKMLDSTATKSHPLDLTWPDTHEKLSFISTKLEALYKDMVDLEFTVQKGELFILQSRVGKRSARAAFQIAVDLVSETVIDQKTALGRLTADQFKVMRRPMIDPSFKEKPHLVGLPACPGVVTGRPVFSSEEAVKAKDPVILVTHETDPDDIAGMAKAVGILTQTGGATSHAAVVARAMDKPCVVGCSQMELMDGMIGITGKLTNADVTIDGATGRVWVGVKVPVIDASEDPAIQTVMGWCMSDLGACELSPVGLGMDKPHRITAALWWGNESVLDAILADLEELPSREHIVLDLQHPNMFAQAMDAALLDAFGQHSVYDEFTDAVRKQLVQRSAKLQGLALANTAVMTLHPAKLEQLGYVMGVNSAQAGTKAVPKDYAAFTRLSH